MTAAPVAPAALGPFIDEHYVLLRHVLNLRPRGVALEFGVGKGLSLAMIAEHMPTCGFDSFQGLPEDWRPGFPKGSFATDPPTVPYAQIFVGLFADTLPTFGFAALDIGLVHIDCDLYSSTKTVLENVGPHLNDGAYIVFDEWHGYPGCQDHEQRAWHEYAEQTGTRWEPVAHSFQQFCLRIRSHD